MVTSHKYGYYGMVLLGILVVSIIMSLVFIPQEKFTNYSMPFHLILIGGFLFVFSVFVKNIKKEGKLLTPLYLLIGFLGCSMLTKLIIPLVTTNQIIHIISAVSLIGVAIRIFLFVVIFRLSSSTFVTKLRTFAWMEIILMGINFSVPFLVGLLAERDILKFEKAMFWSRMISAIINLVPYAILLWIMMTEQEEIDAEDQSTEYVYE